MGLISTIKVPVAVWRAKPLHEKHCDGLCLVQCSPSAKWVLGGCMQPEVPPGSSEVFATCYKKKKKNLVRVDDSHSWQARERHWICCWCLAAVHCCCQGNRLDGNKDQWKLSLASSPLIPTAISMETVAVSQRQRSYHWLTNVRCGHQPGHFRYAVPTALGTSCQLPQQPFNSSARKFTL